MSELIYEQKEFLTLYRKFFGQEYPTNIQVNRETHIQAQMMGYILSQASIHIGDYGYLWDTYGPSSSGLQDDFNFLDNNIEKIVEFYNQYPKDDMLFTLDEEINGLFSKSQEEKIDWIVKELKIREHKDDICWWMQLLGSMSFIANCNLPNSSFEKVNNNLMTRMPQYNDITINRNVWKALIKTNIIQD